MGHDVSTKLLEGLDDVVVSLSEGTDRGRTFVVTPHAIDVRRIRDSLGMTQKEFAVQFGFPLSTVQSWEQGRRQPEGPARAYLAVIQRRPTAVVEALHEFAARIEEDRTDRRLP